MRIIVFFLLISLGVKAQDTSRWNKAPNFGMIFDRLKASKIFLPPTDTTFNKFGLATIGTTVYIGNGVRWTAVSGSGSSVNFADSIDFTGSSSGQYLRINPGGSGLKKYDFAFVGGIVSLTGNAPVVVTGSGNSRDIGVDTVNRPIGLVTLGKWAKDSAITAAAINAKPNFGDIRATVADSLNVLREKLRLDSIANANVNAVQTDSLLAHNTRILANQNLANTNAANIATKENIITASNNFLRYWNGYKNFVPLNKDSVGLGNVPNVNATNASNITSGTLDNARLSSNVQLNTLALNFRYTANYTLTLSDNAGAVITDNASANNVTIPNNSDVAFLIGTQITLIQKGVGQTSILAAAGVTLNFEFTSANKLIKQNSFAYALKIGTNEWMVTGSLTR